MRSVGPETRKHYVETRRVRYKEPGQPRELTCSCYRHSAFLGRDRTREWVCLSMRPEHVHLLVYPGDNPDRMAGFLQALAEPVCPPSHPVFEKARAAMVAQADGA